MRAILEVQWGRSKGRKAVLEPGENLRIGRTEHADWVFEHDRSMAALHCVVQWDGATARVRDARGLPETLIGGAALADGVITHGGWIRAGETVVSLHIEAFTPARREADAIWSDEKRRALEALSSAEPLFAVLDAARDPRILQLLRESVHEALSLYDGVQGDALASVAPYVVALPRGSRLLQQLVLEGWGKRWGVFLSSPAPLAEVRRHLRRFLLVADDLTGRRLYFRFYDPAALRAFLACATTRQASAFFLNIDRLLVEDEAAAAEVVQTPAV